VNLCAQCSQAADQLEIDIPSKIRDWLTVIERSFPNLHTRVDVGTDPSYLIPEVGAGGSTDPSTGAVAVSLDSFADQRSMFTVWLPFIMAHELDHAGRILRTSGYR
jgi:hypothetical protein